MLMQKTVFIEVLGPVHTSNKVEATMLLIGNFVTRHRVECYKVTCISNIVASTLLPLVFDLSINQYSEYYHVTHEA